MEELKKQIDRLLVVVEEQKLKHMCYGQITDCREDDGYIQALKFVKLLINTNLAIK